MAQAEIQAGICGYKTTVQTAMDGDLCTITIESECKAIQRLAGQLATVDPLREFTFRGDGPETFNLAERYCSHAACPVPVGIIKAIEVEAGLALPQDVSIKLSK
jgi:hypothetical protein